MDIAHFLFGIFGGFSFLSVEVLSPGFWTDGSSVSLSLATRKCYCSVPLLGPNVCIIENHLSLSLSLISYGIFFKSNKFSNRVLICTDPFGVCMSFFLILRHVVQFFPLSFLVTSWHYIFNYLLNLKYNSKQYNSCFFYSFICTRKREIFWFLW